MKLFIYFAVAFIGLVASVNADYPKEPNEEHNKIISQCRAKFVFSDEEYIKLRHDEIANPDENMQCFLNCFMERVGILKDGKFQQDAATEMFNRKVGEEKSKNVVEACHGESGTKNCETAAKLHKCFIKNGGY